MRWFERLLDWIDRRERERGKRKCLRTGKHGKILDDAEFLPDGSALIYGRCERCGETSQPVPATIQWTGRCSMKLSPIK